MIVLDNIIWIFIIPYIFVLCTLNINLTSVIDCNTIHFIILEYYYFKRKEGCGYSLTVLEPMKASGSSSNMDANKYLTLNVSYNVYKNGVYKGSVAVTIRYHLNTSPAVTFG